MKASWEKIKNKLDKLNTYIDSKRGVENSQEFDRRKNSGENKAFGQACQIRKKIIYIALFIWVFTLGFYFALFSGISGLAGKIGDKIELASENTFSLYKPGIDIMARLKGTNYLKYIQRLYVHPKEENLMIIMIKPNYWGVISQKEKDRIKSEILKKWEIIYKNSNYDEILEPQVKFANS